jgi:beta-lactamase regulating signal transducer with metallopeptidase domain
MIAELLSENQFVWTCLCQSTVCAAAGIIGSFILKHRPARAHQVLLLAITAAVVVPAMSVLVKHLDLGLFSAEPAAVRSEREVTLPETAYAAAEIIAGDIIEYEPPAVEAAQDGLTAAVAAQKTGIPWSRMLSWAWIAASLILAARLGVTFVRGMRILRRATPVPCQEIQQAVRAARAKLGIAEDVSVLASRNIRSPVIWCWSRRPAFLVPNTASQSGDGINWVSVLCHELAHYKRHDHISGLLAEIAACALPWNLLLWWTKSRLVKFSEQACDDWVLSSGQSGADYARSLLDLVPQGQMALLPTVVASKKELQTRVRRIVQNRCGDPRAGGRWAVLVTTVAACLALGTALAQEGRTDKETPRREAAASERGQEGEVSREQVREPREAERAELIQLRQTLLGKISGIERELKELPDDRDVEARELQARLRAIRDQIRDIDRKLAGPEREREDIRLQEQRQADVRTRELAEHRRSLQQRAQQIERRLTERPDNPDAPQLQTELEEIRPQIRRIESQLRDAEGYRPESGPQVRGLIARHDQLQEKARDMERRLAEQPDGPEARELQAGLREIQEQIRRIKQELAELQRPPRERPERQRPEQARAEELRQAIARLVEQGRADEAERLERELRQITQQPPERPEPRPEAPGLEQQVQQLRNELQGLRREMAELRELLKQLLQRPAPASSDAIRGGGQRPERERSPEAERLEREPRPEKEEIGMEKPRF